MINFTKVLKKFWNSTVNLVTVPFAQKGLGARDSLSVIQSDILKRRLYLKLQAGRMVQSSTD